MWLINPSGAETGIFGKTIWIPWLMMTWRLVSSGHQQPWYMLHDREVLLLHRSSVIYVISAVLRNDRKCKYKYNVLFAEMYLAPQRLTTSIINRQNLPDLSLASHVGRTTSHVGSFVEVPAMSPLHCGWVGSAVRPPSVLADEHCDCHRRSRRFEGCSHFPLQCHICKK